MKLNVNFSKIPNYFKEKKKHNLFIGSLLFASGVTATLPGFIRLFYKVPIIGLSMQTFDTLIANFAYSLLLILPSFLLFATAYLLWENHALGWKLAIALSGIAILAAAANYLNVEYALIIAFLSGLAAMLQIRHRKSHEETKSSPIVTENLAKFGLSLSGIICVSILLGMIVYIGAKSITLSIIGFLDQHKMELDKFRPNTKRRSTGSMGGVLGFAVGSLLVVAFCEVIAIPLGLGAAIYLSEYSSQNKITSIIRFFIETLPGVPSVIIGLVGLAVFVEALHWGNSLYGAGLSLAFMILPWNIELPKKH